MCVCVCVWYVCVCVCVCVCVVCVCVCMHACVWISRSSCILYLHHNMQTGYKYVYISTSVFISISSCAEKNKSLHMCAYLYFIKTPNYHSIFAFIVTTILNHPSSSTFRNGEAGYNGNTGCNLHWRHLCLHSHIEHGAYKWA